MDPERLFTLLKNLIDTMPDLHGAPITERVQWLARASALIGASPNSVEGMRFREAMDALASKNYTSSDNPAAVAARSILMRTFAITELNAPAGLYPGWKRIRCAGRHQQSVFRGFSFLARRRSKSGRKAVYGLPTAPEAVSLQVLSDSATCKPSFAPAVARWKALNAGKLRISHISGVLLPARRRTGLNVHAYMSCVDNRMLGWKV